MTRAVQHYTFSVPCDHMREPSFRGQCTTRRLTAIQAATEHHSNTTRPSLSAKTTEMNRQLNEEIPWFRCPDEKFVDIYYYLWSLYLMYSHRCGHKDGRRENHTQTAVNNFLGIHRYDAAFQIKVGAWTTDKRKYAYGNVLTWKHLTKNDRFRASIPTAPG